MSFQSNLKLKKSRKAWIYLLAAASVCITVYYLDVHHGRTTQEKRLIQDIRLVNSNNETGADELIVPNIVHFIVFENPNISFVHFVCVLATMRNQRPEKIYFHTNVAQFTGQYWQRLTSLKMFMDILEIKKVEMPTDIFNQPIRSDWRVFHGGDITRIRVLMEHGGIYVDNDSYIVQSLDFFRKFEMAIGWPEGQPLGTQIIVAHKDARFLRLWLHTYDGAYKANKWYFNAGHFPTTSVLEKHPYLVHRVKVLFGTDVGLIFNLFQTYWPDWRQYYTFHLLARKKHQSGLLHNISENATYPVDFDEFNLQNYPITFKEMANEVLLFETYLRPSLYGADLESERTTEP